MNSNNDPTSTHESNLARDAKDAVLNAGQDIKDKATHMAHTAGEKLSDLGEKISTGAGELRDKVGRKMSDLREGAVDLYDKASSRVRTFGEDSVDFARENPVSTVLTAFAAGILLGYTLRR